MCTPVRRADLHDAHVRAGGRTRGAFWGRGRRARGGRRKCRTRVLVAAAGARGYDGGALARSITAKVHSYELVKSAPAPPRPLTSLPAHAPAPADLRPPSPARNACASSSTPSRPPCQQLALCHAARGEKTGGDECVVRQLQQENLMSNEPASSSAHSCQCPSSPSCLCP